MENNAPIIETKGNYVELRWAHKPRFYTLISPGICKIGKPYINVFDTHATYAKPPGVAVALEFWPNGRMDSDLRATYQANGFKYDKCDEATQLDIIFVVQATLDYMNAQEILPMSLSEMFARYAIALRF